MATKKQRLAEEGDLQEDPGRNGQLPSTGELLGLDGAPDRQLRADLAAVEGATDHTFAEQVYLAALRLAVQTWPAPPTAASSRELSAMADQLSRSLSTSWHTPAQRTAVRRCLYHLRVRSSSGPTEKTLYTHLCHTAQQRNHRCWPNYLDRLCQFWQAPAGLSPGSPEACLRVGELFYELYEHRNSVAPTPAVALTVCKQALAYCQPDLGPFEWPRGDKWEGSAARRVLQGLFLDQPEGSNDGACRVWSYSLVLQLAQHWLVPLNDQPEPSDPRVLNLRPPSEEEKAESADRPTRALYASEPERGDPLPDRATSPPGPPPDRTTNPSGQLPDRATSPPSLPPVVCRLYEQTRQWQQYQAGPQETTLRQDLGIARALQLLPAEIRRELGVAVYYLPRTTQVPNTFFFTGPGLHNPDLRRLLPRRLCLADAGVALAESNARVLEETELMYPCRGLAQVDMVPTEVNGRLCYGAPLPYAWGHPTSRQYRLVVQRWSAPLRQLCKEWSRRALGTKVQCDYRPPYEVDEKLPSRVDRLGWTLEQIGWDRAFRPGEKRSDRHLLIWRSLLVGALGLLDPRLNPVLVLGDDEDKYYYSFFGGLRDVETGPRALSRALMRFLTTAAMLSELDRTFRPRHEMSPLLLRVSQETVEYYLDGAQITPRQACLCADKSPGRVLVVSGVSHAFVLHRPAARTELKLYDSLASARYNNVLIQHLRHWLPNSPELASVLGVEPSATIEAPLLSFRQGLDPDCGLQALLLAARLAYEGPGAVNAKCSDAWLLMASALGLRWVLQDFQQATQLFLPFKRGPRFQVPVEIEL